jgi:arabinan endo-1,5-alpha-L-arabinosidase
VTGPYEYAGEVINGKALGILNAIDPYVFRDEGKVWMFFGSCQGGIHRVELTGDGMSIKPGCVPVRVAGLWRKIGEPHIWGKFGAYEGSYLLKRHGWWYLFVSGGKYTDNTYYLTVGRSRTVDGEFVDREGRSMLKGLARPILASQEGAEINGAGHNGEVFRATDDSDWMFFHAHDKPPFKPSDRPTYLQELKWDEKKWPYFEGGGVKRVERRFTVAETE